MAKSIIILLLLGAIFSLICSVLSNLIRAAEIRELRRELGRFKKSFPVIRVVEDPKPSSKSRADGDDLPKFGDE